MLPKRSRPAVLAVLATTLLLTSSVAGLAVAGQPSTSDLQDDDVDGDEVIDSFRDSLETLDTVQFTQTSESTYNGETATSTVRLAVDLQDSQKRIETLNSSSGSDTITVTNGSKSVTYDPSHDSVSEYEVSGEPILLPRMELLANDSVVSYEFDGTETVDGRTAYVLDATPARELSEDAEISMTVYVDTETYFPIRVVSETVTDEGEHSSTVTYRNVTVNEEIPDSTFELDLPDDVSRPTHDYDPAIMTYDSHAALASNASVSIPDSELGDGFTFDGATVISSEDRYSVFMAYSDGEQSISVTTRSENINDIDRSEQDRYDTVDIGEKTGHVYSDGEFTSLSWQSDQPYTVSGYVTDQVAIEIAGSIEEQ